MPKSLFSEIHLCKKCESYTLFPENGCLNCPSLKGFYTLDQFVTRKYRLQFQNHLLLLFTLLVITAVSSLDLTVFLLTTFLGTLILIGYSMWKFSMRVSEKKLLLDDLVLTDQIKLTEGINENIRYAQKKIDIGHYQEAYELLRKIGLYIHNNEIKELKLGCLNQFYLRKDMQLEMDSLLPEGFSPLFIQYLTEAIKVQRNLVNKNVLDYIIRYEEEIQEHFSYDVFITTAGAALRKKQYFIYYKDFIMKYIHGLPKERIIRLCRILQTTNTPELDQVRDQLHNLIQIKYAGEKEMAALL